jgi:hypothetical protein
VWRGIAALLRVANTHPDVPESPAQAREIHRLCRLLEKRQPFVSSYTNWPIALRTAGGNLIAVVCYGGCYVRRCNGCDAWFLAHDNRQRRCRAAACVAAAARERAAAQRQRARADRRRVKKAASR